MVVYFGKRNWQLIDWKVLRMEQTSKIHISADESGP
jgi:hypothetical protein